MPTLGGMGLVHPHCPAPVWLYRQSPGSAPVLCRAAPKSHAQWGVDGVPGTPGADGVQGAWQSCPVPLPVHQLPFQTDLGSQADVCVDAVVGCE